MKVLSSHGETILGFILEPNGKYLGQMTIYFSMIWTLLKYHFKRGRTKILITPYLSEKNKFLVSFIFYRYIKTDKNKVVKY